MLEVFRLSELLGAEIVKLRRARKMTQKGLCAGICSQGTISLIEKGEVTPGIGIISAIAMKLNVPVSYLIEIVHSEDTHLQYEFIRKFESCMSEHNYEKVYELTKTIENKNNNPSWFYYYTQWLNFLSGYYINQFSLKFSLNKIKILYHEADEFEINKKYLAARIINSIAILYMHNKDYKSALFYLNKISLDFKKRIDLFDSIKMHLKICYNKVKMLFDMGETEQATILALEGIKESIENENISLLGQFYFYLGECYELLNKVSPQSNNAYKHPGTSGTINVSI